MEKNSTQQHACLTKILTYESHNSSSTSLSQELSDYFKDNSTIAINSVAYNPFVNKKILEKSDELGLLINSDLENENLNDRKVIFNSFKMVLDANKKTYLHLDELNKDKLLEKAILIISAFQKAQQSGFGATDFVQIYNHGVSIEDIQLQLIFFKKGIKKSILDRPATISDGIRLISNSEKSYYTNLFDAQKEHRKLMKFVPASGAASRMFKFLSEFLSRFDLEKDTINSYINKHNDSSLKIFLAGLEKFPFYASVRKHLKSKYPDFMEWSREQRVYYFVKTILQSPEYNYIEKPKAVLPFHTYKDHYATPIEEHLNEAAYYSSSKGESDVHFTISESHLNYFEAILKDVKGTIEAKHKVKIHVAYSCQQKSTDTLAVDMQNNPFKNENNMLVFRPGGHGALIENLNKLNADIIFIKNIDNVTNGQLELVVSYKKILAGVLIELQERIFHYLNLIKTGVISKEQIAEIIAFIQKELMIALHPDFDKFKKTSRIEYIQEVLNRPIRVCGMVKNEGEPGGGPFWVIDLKGKISLQIVETSQVDTNDSYQLELLHESTHFNPVDLVCGVRDYQGDKFDLTKYVDVNSGFIVQKNNKGRDVKSYELPGLWNGAMANWISIFVEVPLDTFNPVKTVNDLLKSAHQAD